MIKRLNHSNDKHQNVTTKFHNQYRISSARLQEYDYASDGAYFITICAKNRENFFGKIIDNQMQLFEIWRIIVDEWQKTAEIRSNVQLGEWIVMPNHFHGILIIDNDRRDVLTKRLYKSNAMSIISPTKNSISVIIRFFKRQTTIRAKIINPKFSWQSRFYDHVIRNEKDYSAIAEYITFNPLNWENDENFI